MEIVLFAHLLFYLKKNSFSSNQKINVRRNQVVVLQRLPVVAEVCHHARVLKHVGAPGILEVRGHRERQRRHQVTGILQPEERHPVAGHHFGKRHIADPWRRKHIGHCIDVAALDERDASQRRNAGAQAVAAHVDGNLCRIV